MKVGEKGLSSPMPAVIFKLHFLEYNIIHSIMPGKMNLNELSGLEVEVLVIKIFSGFSAYRKK